MRRLFTPLASLAAVMAVSSLLFAQTAPAAPAKQAAHTQAKAEKAAAPSALRATGVIKAATDSKLTLTVGMADKEFVLGAKTVVTEGGKRLSAAELSKAVGQHATVHYTEASGTMTATTVTVAKSSPPKAEESAKK